MAWYSVLPSHLTVYETWIIRTFIVLAVINILPWTFLIIYDLILYISRTVWHEIPVYGGRAQGQRRPRVPSLSDRNRQTSFAEMIRRSSAVEEDQLTGRRQHKKTSSEHVIEEHEEDK